MRLAEANGEDADSEEQDSDNDGGLEDNFFSAAFGAVTNACAAKG